MKTSSFETLPHLPKTISVKDALAPIILDFRDVILSFATLLVRNGHFF